MLERYREIFEQRVKGEEVGFTLIELLIVIVVLGILAAIVVFGLSGVTGQSAQSACNADAKSVEIAVEAYHTQNGQWPVASVTTVPAAAKDYTNELSQSTNLTTANAQGVRDLRTYPNNGSHYIILNDAAGGVFVLPLNGNGGLVTTPVLVAGTGPTAPAINGGAANPSYNYDGTAGITTGNTGSPNPCSYVS